MNTPELIEAVAQQPASVPNNVTDLLSYLAAQPQIQVTPPVDATEDEITLIDAINNAVQTVQFLISLQNSYTVLVQIPAQTSKGIQTNNTREKQLLNVLAYNEETIKNFYDRLLFWKEVRDPDLFFKINVACLSNNVSDFWVGVDDQLNFLSYYGTQYPTKRTDWGESKLIP
jgi:hypothetical protein